jgi:hypothetical protein
MVTKNNGYVDKEEEAWCPSAAVVTAESKVFYITE